MTCDYIPLAKQLNECDWNNFGVCLHSQWKKLRVFSNYSILSGTIFFHETSSQQGHFIDFIGFLFFSSSQPMQSWRQVFHLAATALMSVIELLQLYKREKMPLASRKESFLLLFSP